MAYTEAMNSLIENICNENPGPAATEDCRAWIFGCVESPKKESLDFFSENAILLPV